MCLSLSQGLFHNPTTTNQLCIHPSLLEALLCSPSSSPPPFFTVIPLSCRELSPPTYTHPILFEHHTNEVRSSPERILISGYLVSLAGGWPHTKVHNPPHIALVFLAAHTEKAIVIRVAIHNIDWSYLFVHEIPEGRCFFVITKLLWNLPHGHILSPLWNISVIHFPIWISQRVRLYHFTNSNVFTLIYLSRSSLAFDVVR